MIKNTLISLENELEDLYNNNFNDWDNFIIDLNDSLDYFKFSIYKNAKKIIFLKIGNNSKISLDDTENTFLSSYSFDTFLDKLKKGIINNENLDVKELYDKIVEIVIGECILIYKKFQILICQNNNIDKFKLITDSSCSCEICQLNSKLILDSNNFDINNLHPYCKNTIVPLKFNVVQNLNLQNCEFENIPNEFINIAKSICTKLFIHYKKYITNKKFIFTDVDSIQFKDDILISNNFNILCNLDITKIIVEGLLKDKFLESINLSEWEELYEIKKNSKQIGENCIIYSLPFVNNIASYNCESFVLQSMIYFICDPEKLKQMDITTYNKIDAILKNNKLG